VVKKMVARCVGSASLGGPERDIRDGLESGSPLNCRRAWPQSLVAG
jgi:hypothetical protein